MKLKKRILSLTLTGVLAICMTSCAVNGNAKTSDSKTEDTRKLVKIGVPGSEGDALLENGRLAEKLGYIKEELDAVGYDYEIVIFTEAGPAINEAYASKELDLAVYGDLPASVCKSSGVDIKIIGAVNNQFNLAILNQKNNSIKTPKDLEGKKVIVGRGTNFHQYWQRLVETYDIDESKVEILNIVGDASSVFSSKQADAWITLQKSALYFESQGIGEVGETTVNSPELSGIFLVTGRTAYLDENSEAAEAFLKALKRSQEYAAEHPDEFYEAMSSKLIGAEIYQKAYSFDTTFKYLSPAITDDVREKLEYTSNFLVENGFANEKINIDEFIDTSYYEKIINE